MSEELWIVRGSVPTLFTVPVWVKRHSNYCEAWLAMVLPTYHDNAFQKVMDERFRCVNGMWHMSKGELKQIAELAPSNFSPEECFSWQRRQRVPTERLRRKASEHLDPFIDYCYLAGIGRSRMEVAYWWALFCNAAFDWMINQEKPLDLYFARLHNAPIRFDWYEKFWNDKNRSKSTAGATRNLIYHHLKGSVKHIFSKRKKWSDLSDQLLRDPSFVKRLRGPFQMKVSSHGTVFRRLEVELTRTWWSAVKRVEIERRKVLKPYSYAESCMASLARFTPAAARIFTQRLLASAHPQASACHGSLAGLIRIESHRVVHRRETKRHLRVSARNSVVPGAGPSGPAQDLPRPDGKLSKVHPV